MNGKFGALIGTMRSPEIVYLTVVRSTSRIPLHFSLCGVPEAAGRAFRDSLDILLSLAEGR
jgi:hypothetical protein